MNSILQLRHQGVWLVATYRKRILKNAYIAEFQQAFDEADRNILLQLGPLKGDPCTKVDFIESGVLDYLIRLSLKQRKGNLRLVFTAISPNVQEIFEITRLDQLFEIVTAEDSSQLFS